MKRLVLSSLLLMALSFGGTMFYLNQNPGMEEITRLDLHCSFPAYDLGDLTTQADLILEGTISSSSAARWNNTDNRKPDELKGKDMIMADYVLKVDNVLKGEAPEGNEVVIRTFGGKTSDFVINNDSQPPLQKGEELVVFLIKDTTIYSQEGDDDHWIFLGGSQGAYWISNDELVSARQSIKEPDFMNEVQQFVKNPRKYEYAESIER